MTLNDGNWIEERQGVRRTRARRSMRAVLSVLVSLFLLLLLYVAGFGLFASHVAGMKPPEKIEAADAIIVFTGGHLRLEPAMQLLREGKGRRLLISGVHPSTDSEALRRATGAESRLFQCCVDIDHLALDTVGNALESAKWLAANHFRKSILVTNNYHVPRSLIEMRRISRGTELIPYAVVASRIDGMRWLTDRDVLRVLFIEYNKLVAALGRNLFGI